MRWPCAHRDESRNRPDFAAVKRTPRCSPTHGRVSSRGTKSMTLARMSSASMAHCAVLASDRDEWTHCWRSVDQWATSAALVTYWTMKGHEYYFWDCARVEMRGIWGCTSTRRLQYLQAFITLSIKSRSFGWLNLFGLSNYRILSEWTIFGSTTYRISNYQLWFGFGKIKLLRERIIRFLKWRI